MLVTYQEQARVYRYLLVFCLLGDIRPHIAALGVYVRTTIATTANNKHVTRFI